jgi:hypothetical protein
MTVYKRMSIDLRELSDRLHTLFGVCMKAPEPGLYYDGAFTPLITDFSRGYYYLDPKTRAPVAVKAEDFASGKINGQAVYLDHIGRTVIVPKGMWGLHLCGGEYEQSPGASSRLPTAGLIAEAAICDQIRRKVNSPFYPYRVFDAREHLVDSASLAQLALSPHGWLGIDNARYIKMLTSSNAMIDEATRVTVMRDIGISVEDEIDIQINRACDTVWRQIEEFIGVHVDNLYTYRIVGKVMVIEQGMDYRAQAYLQEQESRLLNQPSH